MSYFAKLLLFTNDCQLIDLQKPGLVKQEFLGLFSTKFYFHHFIN